MAAQDTSTSASLGRGAPARTGFDLGSLFGVQIHVDWSLLIIFALIAFNLGAGVFSEWHPDWGGLVSWVTAVAAALLFLASILAHELAHAVVARSRGVPISRITLFLFGGIAHMEGEPPSPSAEFLIAIAGPVASLLIGVLATTAGATAAGDAFALAVARQDPAAVEVALQGVGPVATLLLWLGPINILLAAFNLIPGFPLDGGRVLRAIVWGITGDLVKATRWASLVGRTFAWLLMGVGVMDLFGGAIVQGIWLLVIGWFLNVAARMSYVQLQITEALSAVPVTVVMRTGLTPVSPELTVAAFVHDHLMATDQHAFPVEVDGHLVGLACARDVRKVPAAEWMQTTVGDVMTPVEKLVILSIDSTAAQAFKALVRTEVNQIPVLRGADLVGVVRRRDLLKWLALQSGDFGDRAQLGWRT